MKITSRALMAALLIFSLAPSVAHADKIDKRIISEPQILPMKAKNGTPCWNEQYFWIEGGLKPRSVALYGEFFLHSQRFKDEANLKKYYVVWKKDHYYPWTRVRDLLHNCLRPDLLDWMKEEISPARNMREYKILGANLYNSVGLKGDSPKAILQAWCSLIKPKTQTTLLACT